MYSKVLLAQLHADRESQGLQDIHNTWNNGFNCLTNFFLSDIDIFFTLNFTEFDNLQQSSLFHGQNP